MANFSKLVFSGSTGGKQILITTDSAPGTTIHTVPNTSGLLDEIWLYAQNSDTSAVLLTIEIGGTTDPDNLMTLSIPASAGLTLILPGLVYNDVVIKAHAETGKDNLVLVSGFVNRIS